MFLFIPDSSVLKALNIKNESVRQLWSIGSPGRWPHLALGSTSVQSANIIIFTFVMGVIFRIIPEFRILRLQIAELGRLF